MSSVRFLLFFFLNALKQVRVVKYTACASTTMNCGLGYKEQGN